MQATKRNGEGRHREFRKLWNREVRGKMAAGMSLTAARSAVAREIPALREELLAASKPTEPVPLPMTAVEGERLTVEFETAISDQMRATGVNRQRATAAIVAKYPALQRAVVAAANL